MSFLWCRFMRGRISADVGLDVVAASERGMREREDDQMMAHGV